MSIHGTLYDLMKMIQTVVTDVTIKIYISYEKVIVKSERLGAIKGDLTP